MALFTFTRQILAGEPVKLFNYGNHTRDFTYIDDIVEGVIRASDQIAEVDTNWDAAHPGPATSRAPFRLFNIGNNSPVRLGDYVIALEEALGRKAELELLPLQPGEVLDTYADVAELVNAVGYRPTTDVKDGVKAFVDWYLAYNGK